MDEVKRAIRDVPDFPKKGIIFKDITPILKDPRLFKRVLDAFCDRYAGKDLTAVLAVESRGFIFGGALADRLNVAFIPIRKKGKLPYKTVNATYALEYGTDTIEMHADALGPDDRVLVFDDLVATGGTARAAAQLAEALGARVVECGFVIELAFLNPRDTLKGYPFFSLVQF